MVATSPQCYYFRWIATLQAPLKPFVQCGAITTLHCEIILNKRHMMIRGLERNVGRGIAEKGLTKPGA